MFGDQSKFVLDVKTTLDGIKALNKEQNKNHENQHRTRRWQFDDTRLQREIHC